MIDPALFQENERTAPSADERMFADVGALDCECGQRLESVTVAYETWGSLNADRSNAVLICHALSGDAHAIGWWDRLIGPGKAFDTDRYFVIGTNALGGCQGTTGPASLAPDGKPYGSRFPMITIGDMVDVQARLMDQLGISQLLCVAGGSMGGMQALEWTVRYPERVRKAFVTASCARHSPMQIAINEVGRQAILRDPHYRGGDYYDGEPPANGLSVARMIGHISFLSNAAFESKFSRRLQDKAAFDMTFGVEFQVESYLSYQGDKFTKRFDPNSLLHLTRAIDYYDWTDVERAKAEFLFVSYTSDWLYTPEQSSELYRMTTGAGKRASYYDIDLPYGHDAFLLDGELQAAHLREFLSS
ncbi:MAG: homoserine O-acetyltransferase [Armatimonadetes bacterium]|nr:homoserine O-acetyltransferase [Armatimonadota bacterium]